MSLNFKNIQKILIPTAAPLDSPNEQRAQTTPKYTRHAPHVPLLKTTSAITGRCSESFSVPALQTCDWSCELNMI